MPATPASSTLSTGIAGLDFVLGNGLPTDRIYLVQGDPGVGKTTLALHFLLAGVAAGETCLYVALTETQAEIEAVVESHGWSTAGLNMIELSALERSVAADVENTLFEPNEVELQETTRMILADVERLQPTRVVFDSLSELRLLAQTPLRYRRQLLGLKQFFANRNSTVVLLDDRSADSDQHLLSVAHGVISMEQLAPEYGADRRRLRVAKLRGVAPRSGYHEFAIHTGGITVFPRIVPSEHRLDFAREHISSGIRELDDLLGGGMDYGTSTLILGPAGSGKSSVAVQYAVAAVQRGERAALFAFDERVATVYERTRALGVDLAPYVKAGKLHIQQIDPAEMGPGEFAFHVQQAVEKGQSRLVLIDSLNGYLHAMSSEKQLNVQLHELLSYLGNRGVATIMVMAQHGLTGTIQSPVDVSYLADTVVLLRYFETGGRVHKAISVMKKRSGSHEHTIRELTLDRGGLKVGAPVTDFTGVLSGTPQYRGRPGELTGRG